MRAVWNPICILTGVGGQADGAPQRVRDWGPDCAERGAFRESRGIRPAARMAVAHPQGGVTNGRPGNGGGAGEERPPPSPPFHSPVCMPAAPALSVTLTSFFLGPAVTWRRARSVLTSFCHPRVPPRPTPWAFKKGRLDLLCRCRPVSQPLPILCRRCLFRTIATRPLSPPPPPFGSHPLTPRRHSRWPSPP